MTKLRLGIGGLLAATALTACGSSTATTNAGAQPTLAPATTGYQLVFLGDMTQTAQTTGIKLALADFAQAHPDAPKVTVVYEDSKGDATKAVPLAYAITADPAALGVVGPTYSGESAAVNPIFNRAGLPEISAAATNATLTATGWKTFHRLVANDASQGRAGAAYIKKAGKKRVFLIDDEEAYGAGLVGYVRNGLGDLVVGADSTAYATTDFSATIAKVEAANADTVYYGGYYTGAAALVKQLRAAGWTGLFMSGDGSEDPRFTQQAGAAADGAVLTMGAGPAPADFATKFAAASNGAAPGPNATQAYDATTMMLQGILAGNTTRAKLQAYISSYHGTGVSGPISFDADGDINNSVVWVYKVHDAAIDVDHPTPIK
jgi:branched-chain amino acid transport system substrate-binding protein